MNNNLKNNVESHLKLSTFKFRLDKCINLKNAENNISKNWVLVE